MKKLRGMRKQDAAINGGTRYCSVAAAVIGSAVVGGVVASSAANKSASAARDAAASQSVSAGQGIDEQRREFDLAQQTQNSRYADVQKILAPYVNAGNGAVQGQQNLLGLGPPGTQQSAVDSIQNSPQFAAMAQQGENGILANASATGGLRGGNTEAALAQFRPALLSSLIDQQYQRLGGLSSLGQNAAAGVGNSGIQTGAGIASGALATGQGIAGLYGQQGAAQAGASLAQARAFGQEASGISNAFGTAAGTYAAYARPAANPTGNNTNGAVYGPEDGTGSLF